MVANSITRSPVASPQWIVTRRMIAQNEPHIREHKEFIMQIIIIVARIAKWREIKSLSKDIVHGIFNRILISSCPL